MIEFWLIFRRFWGPGKGGILFGGRRPPPGRALMRFAKKWDLQKMKTVSQFGYFFNIFCHFEGSLDKGGIPKVPPLYEEGPLQAGL